MPKLSSLLAIIALTVLCASCGDQKSSHADMIIYSDQIYTGTTDSSPEAVIILDGAISAVTDRATTETYVGPDTEIIDAKGSFVMPGLIEGHGHFSGLGEFLMNLNFLKAKSWDEIVGMVAEKVEQSEPGEWIIGRGWHQEKWMEPVEDHVHGYPKHFDLSAISPDNPVLLDHASGHGIFVNQKAMELAGINAETPNPAGGRIVRDENGQAIGVFEENAEDIIKHFYHEYLETLSDEDRLNQWYKGVELAQDECFKKGITSFQDAGSHFEEVDRYKALAEDGDMRIRLWAMIREPLADIPQDLSAYKMIGVGNNHFTCRALKVALDGALGSFGAWLLEPYTDKADFYGQNTTSIEEITSMGRIARANDMQFCVHAIGDRANRETLDIIELLAPNKEDDLRWRIEHSQHLHPDDIGRFAQLGAIPSMQGIHCTSDAPYVEKRLGRQRAQEGAYNWRALIDSGAIVTNGTDAPVEDIDPIESFYASVTRKRADNGMEFFTENKMTRAEALRSYTYNNAYAAFEEELKGTIEVGKLADFTILSENWLTCSDDAILDTQVEYTIVGGQVMYKQ
jgi:predicted amidohydrolase YtcJ